MKSLQSYLVKLFKNIEGISNIGEVEKDAILDKIGDSIYGGINMDGSITCSTYEAKKWIKYYWDECGNFIEEYQNEFGEIPCNPFSDPERFMVAMCIFYFDRAIYKIDWEKVYRMEEVDLSKDYCYKKAKKLIIQKLKDLEV